MTVTYHVGDSRAVIATIPDGSVDLVASSPPFLALRSYLPAGHEAKGDEIGSEANPAAFLDTLLELTAEWGRVLAPHGSLAIELGDTYSGSGGAGGDYNDGGLREGQDKWTSQSARIAESNSAQHSGSGAATIAPSGSPRSANESRRGVDAKNRGNTSRGTAKLSRGNDAWPLAKSLALIPQLYAVALAYGINPLTGQPSPAGQWRVRNVIVWHRPNPAVGALGDKVRPSTSYIVVATRSAKRWFDLTAVRNTASDVTRLAYGYAMVSGEPNHDVGPRALNPAGAPPLDAWFDSVEAEATPFDVAPFHDTWTLTTQPSSLAHYAMWPAKLAERLILMMCPLAVCRICGEPRRRMERDNDELAAVKALVGDKWTSGGLDKGLKRPKGADRIDVSGHKLTLGWTDCGHDDYRSGVVLDPFCGTGTSLAVADLHGRDAIGIDIDERNRDIYPARYDEVKRALYGTPPPMPGQEAFDFAI